MTELLTTIVFPVCFVIGVALGRKQTIRRLHAKMKRHSLAIQARRFMDLREEHLTTPVPYTLTDKALAELDGREPCACGIVFSKGCDQCSNTPNSKN